MRALPGTTWNSTGFRGVEKVRDRYRATIGDHAWRSAYYSSPAAAAKAYDRETRRRHGRHGFYNFPRVGEKKIRPADPDLCCRGPERAVYMRYRRDGRPAFCLACNRLSRMRSAARKART